MSDAGTIIQSFLKHTCILFVLLGIILLIFGASEGLKIGENSIELTNQTAKWIIIVVGIVLITIGIIWGIKDNKLASGPTASSDDIPNKLGDITLAGRWNVYYEFDTKQTSDKIVGIAEIDKPQGNKFSMKITLSRSKLGRAIHTTFLYEGVIKNTQILCNFRSEGSTGDFMVGTMVMHPSPQGDKIFCGATYLNNFNHIVMDPCLLMKK